MSEKDLTEELTNLRIGFERYETVRRMNPELWTKSWLLSIETGKPFDQIIDELKPFIGSGKFFYKKGFENEENNNRATVPAADLEQNSSHASLGKKEITGFNTPVNIKVISYRRVNHDTDGVSVKAVLDGIVLRGILTDDSAKQIKSITFESRISEEEKTIIEIED